jgi:poly(3-hydroxybutyrate) depolymerase
MLLARKSRLKVVLLVLSGVLAAGCNEQAPPASDALPHLGARIDRTSASGISSGAYMAGQFQMAHAKIVTGAAIIAGGPYGCSESIFADAIPGPGGAFINLTKAINGCMLNTLGPWGAADPKALAARAKDRAGKAEIDPISDVKADRIYLFSGSADHTVVEPIVEAAANFYRELGVPESNIKFVHNLPAGHAFVTDGQGGACDRSGEPYVVDCHYDQAGELLHHIYGALKPRTESPDGEYFEFNQRAFGQGSVVDSLADKAIVYIPKACRQDAGCSIHIAFHGCAQNRAKVGDAFIKSTGFARWADTNNMIVLFPQTALVAFNPQGCWDWWGYTGQNFLTRDAAQISAVRKMLDALASR